MFNLPTRRLPYVHQFSLGLQRELPWQVKLDASYVGSRARALMTNEFRSGGGHGINANTVEQLARARQDSKWYTQAVANPFAGLLPGTSLNSTTVARSQLLRPYPQFLGITEGLENVGKTWYNSFQLVLEKRFSNGLTFTSSYTLSKNIAALDYLNDQDLAPSRALLDSDRTHRWVFSGVYEMPFGKGRRFGGGAGRGMNLLLGGWQFNWIATLQSGDPMVYTGAADLMGNPRYPSQRCPAGSTRACCNWTAPAASRMRRAAALCPARSRHGQSGRPTRCGPPRNGPARCGITGPGSMTCR